MIKNKALKPAYHVTLNDPKNNKKIELPVFIGSSGAPVIGTEKLYKDLGYFTYDPGFANTASIRSNITYIDGEKGTLLYRGYDIGELVKYSNYLEVSYLLIHGELPNPQEMAEFTRAIKSEALIHEGYRGLFHTFKRASHPMSLLMGLTGAMPSFYPDENLVNPTHDDLMKMAYHLVGKMPTFVAWVYKFTMGQAFVQPTKKLDYSSNFLKMMFERPDEEYIVNEVVSKTLDKMFILHADHGQNASSSTVRLSASGGTNPYAAISAGVATLWGPAHGGANEAVIHQLRKIATMDNIPAVLKRAKDPNDSFRLMGFGHRVYKNYDPRALLIRDEVMAVLQQLNMSSPFFDLAQKLEELVLADSYFQERCLFPNLDFYSGIMFEALGIPTHMYTALFALSRSAGWSSQLIEQTKAANRKIGRPRQLYTGSKLRKYPVRG